MSESELESEKGGFKIISWNINGIRTIDVKETLSTLNGQIVAFQETKTTRDQLEESVAFQDNYTSYFSFSKNRNGYSGVATYVNNEITPIKAEEGLSGIIEPNNKLYSSQEDQENSKIGHYCSLAESELKNARYGDFDGRAIVTQHLVLTPEGEEKLLTVFNVYCPRLRDDPSDPISNNTEFKQTFHSILGRRALKLVESGSFVLIVGDYNLLYQSIDQPEEKLIQNSFSEWMEDLINEGQFKDTFRFLHPEREQAYTCWSTRTNARQNNFGARIDFILADHNLIKYLKTAEIHPEIMGSDHCPISASFHSLILVPSLKIPFFSTKYFPEFSGKQIKIESFLVRGRGIPSKNDSSTSSATATGTAKIKVKSQSSLMNYFSKKPKLESLELEKQHVLESGFSCTSTNNEINNMFFKEVNKNASQMWKNLMKTPNIPLCSGHNEPCVQRTVRKKGINQGRLFWACSRGNGQISDPNANCNFFQFCNSKK